MCRAQRFARHRLRDAFATFSLLDVAFELFFKHTEARKEHFGRMPADSAIGSVAHDRGLSADLVEHIGLGVERENLFEQCLDMGYPLAARHALAARWHPPARSRSSCIATAHMPGGMASTLRSYSSKNVANLASSLARGATDSLAI